jgi:6-phosphogluconolactonase
MAEIQIELNRAGLIEVAANMAANSLTNFLISNDRVCWALAGGNTPLQIYKKLADSYQTEIDWHRIDFILGDERIVPLHDKDSNWQQINNVFFDKLDIKKEAQQRPLYELSAEEAAKSYGQTLEKLKTNDEGLPKIDYMWLGMGEDGHTLSLFPGDDIANMEVLVVPVHNAPKPPPDRISLSLKALRNVKECLIIIVGLEKSEALKKAISQDSSLPIVQAVNTIEMSGGKVTWLVDKQAASTL